MSPAVPDDILLRRFAEFRDERDFAEIVRRHAGMVFGTCRRMLGDASCAEDVSQETFLRLMRKPEAVTHSLAGWLHTAASQLCIDFIRSESARRRREKSYAEQSVVEASSWQEISPHIDEALLELPEEQRELLVQYFLEGIGQRELAERRGVSISTISRSVSSALDQLRRKLGKKGIVIAAAVLLECLALDTAEAVPTSLTTELGKMAMVSGGVGRSVILPKSPVNPIWLKLGNAWLIGGMCILTAILAGWIFSGLMQQKMAKPVHQVTHAEERR